MDKRTDLDGLDRYIALGYSAATLAKIFAFPEREIRTRKHGQLGCLYNDKIKSGHHIKVKPIYRQIFPDAKASGIVTEDMGEFLRVRWSGSQKVTTIAAQYVERAA